MGLSPATIRIESLPDGVVALRLVGEHGAGTAASFQEKLDDVLASARAVIVDCSLGDFSDGSVLKAVLEAQNDPRNSGKTIVLEFQTDDVLQEALEASGLLDFFPIADSELGAVDLASHAQLGAPWKIVGVAQASPRAFNGSSQAFRWRICRFDDGGDVTDEREVTVFVADGGLSSNESLERARATEGRSVLATLLETANPPSVVTITEHGSLVTEE
jgi:anti-anti-sigma factor